MLTYEDVKNNSAVRTYIQRADESLTALGYTEHSFAHVTAVTMVAISSGGQSMLSRMRKAMTAPDWE